MQMTEREYEEEHKAMQEKWLEEELLMQQLRARKQAEEALKKSDDVFVDLKQRDFEKFYISNVDNHMFLQEVDAFNYKGKKLRGVFLKRPDNKEEFQKLDWSMYLLGVPEEKYIGQAKYDGQQWVYRLFNENVYKTTNLFGVWKYFIDMPKNPTQTTDNPYLMSL